MQLCWMARATSTGLFVFFYSSSPDLTFVVQGTWQFMSIDQLAGVAKRHSITDDVESCFWVLLYIAVHSFVRIRGNVPLTMFAFKGQCAPYKNDTYL